MVNIILESIRAVIVCVIFVNLLYVGSKKNAHLQKGWFYIKLGFGLFLFAMILDISDNFLWLNKYAIFGETIYHAILEKLVGYLLGFLSLAIGFWKWLPAVLGYRKLLDDLELKVEKRTAELETANKQLCEQAENEINSKSELIRAKEISDLANRARMQFVANMGHEIRTPLNVIKGYSQILKKHKNLNEEQIKAVDTIEQNGNILLGLINDVLDISKIEYGGMKLHQRDFDLAATVKDISEIFKRHCAEKGLAWIVKGINVNHKIYVNGDEIKIRQVLIDLLSNAVKCTEDGNVSLKIFNNTNNDYMFMVDDTGGIEREELKPVFAHCGKGYDGVFKGGAGLGLSIAEKQIELMGGNLYVKTLATAGASFFFTIQLKKAENPNKSISAKRGAVLRLAKGCSVKVLVVDDNLGNRELLSKILAFVGVEVIKANNGASAINMAREHLPDAVFSDYCMPGLSGVETIKQIKNIIGDKVKTFIVSAYSSDEDFIEDVKSVCDDVIAKPFNDEEIYRSMADILDVKFEYENGEDDNGDLSEIFDVKNAVCQLPQEMLVRLNEAAKFNEISDLENCLDEIKSINPQALQLSMYLKGLLDNYDMKGISDTLSSDN